MEKTLIEKELSDISDLINNKQFPSAEKKLRTLIKSLKPHEQNEYNYFINSVLFLSEVLTKSAKLLIAADELERVLKEFPFDEKILREIYTLSIKLKRVQRAETILNSLIHLNPDDLNNRIVLIQFYLAMEENNKAIMELKKIIESGAFDAKIHNLLVNSYLKSGLFTEALKHIAIMQELLPDNSYTSILEAKILIEQHKISDAFAIINQIIEEKYVENDYQEILLLIEEYYPIFLKTGHKEDLVEYLIQLLASGNKFDSENLKKIELICQELKVKPIFNFFIFNQKIITDYPGLNEWDLLLNLVYLLENSDKFDDQKFNIRNYFEPVYEQIFPQQLHIFIQSLIFYYR